MIKNILLLLCIAFFLFDCTNIKEKTLKRQIIEMRAEYEKLEKKLDSLEVMLVECQKMDSLINKDPIFEE